MLFSCLLCGLTPAAAVGQTANPQHLLLSGLSTLNAHGQINAAALDANGHLFLLLDEGDGIRLLKTDSNASAVLAQAHLGAQRDSGVALALDSAGNVYVTGLSGSGTLTGTAGAAFPSPTDSSLNSFVMRLDNQLDPVFLSFTGGSRIQSTAIAVSSDAIFVTGYTYAANLPVTASAIQQQPAYNSEQNGFVERFSLDGSTLAYATYLTGANGSTTPAALAVDSTDQAIVAGQTSASGFPTVNALVPVSLSSPSGFLLRLSAAADGILSSTFIPGNGLTSLTLDSTGQVLLASGSVALGQFPVQTVTMPLVPATYQVLLRLPLDLSTVLSSTLVAPGTQSSVASGPAGSAWVAGNLTLPLLPLPALLEFGDSFVAQVSGPDGAMPDSVSTDARLGGTPNQDPTYASLPASLVAVAVDPSGDVFAAGGVTLTASSSLLASETYDLPLLNTPTAALPSLVSQAATNASACSGSLCSGAAAYLSKLAPAAGSALAFSTEDAPYLVLRNLGSSAAAAVSLSVSTGSFTTNCAATLDPGAECDLLLTGSAAGTVSVLYAEAITGAQTTTSASYPPPAASSGTVVFFPKELDFGIVSADGAPQTRTFTVSNLGSTAQTFDSAPIAYSGTVSPFSEVQSTCPTQGLASTKLLAAGQSCQITLAFSAYSNSTQDGYITSQWNLGLPNSRALILTAYSQAAALNLSASEIDFGTQIAGNPALPRLLYISNNSSATQAHTAVSLPAGSPFTLTDKCAAQLPPASVCQIRIDYLSPTAPSSNSATLNLDQGLSVLLTGQTLPPAAVSGSSVDPSLSVSPASVTFTSPILVTASSGPTETVSITNSGSSPFALALAVSGDFSYTTSCGSQLSGGATCAVALSFTPTAPGTRSGLLSVTAGAASPVDVPLTGTALAILSANNGAIGFPATFVGEPFAQSFTVSGQFAALTASTTGPYSVVLIPNTGFGFGAPPPSSFSSSVTGACQDCYLGIQFLPTAAGAQSGTLTLTSSASGAPYVLQLSGTGITDAGLILSPSAAVFSAVPVGSQSAPQRFTLTNLLASGSPASLPAPSLTGDFALVTNPANPAACGATLAYGASCLIDLVFKPMSTGTRSGLLSLSGSASASLSGVGAATPALLLSPSALSFQIAPDGSATVQTVTATNSGGAPITLGSPTIDSTSFQFTSACTGTLAPGATCSLTVSFTPGATAAAGTLSLPYTFAGDALSANVSLAGNYTASSAGLQLFPSQASFAPAATGTSGGTQLFTLSNFTSSALTVTSNYPSQFVPFSAPCTSLNANESCSFSVTFTPLVNGPAAGSITLQAAQAGSGAVLTAIAYGEGYGQGSGGLALSGGLLVDNVYSFGQVTSGESASVTFTLTNTNPAALPPETIRGVASQPPFLSSTTCGLPLSSGQSCSVTVTYSPLNQISSSIADPATAFDQGVLTLAADSGIAPLLIDLTGSGTPVQSAAPTNAQPLATYSLSSSALAFPATQVGSASVTQPITLTNTGTGVVHILALTAPADFTVQSSCASVAPAGTCTISIASTPQTPGMKIGALEISSDAANSLAFISLVADDQPASLLLTPGSLDFGSVQVGSSSTLALQIFNPGSQAATLTTLSASGDYAVGGGCELLLQENQPLGPGSTCTAEVTFSPTATGARAGDFSLTSSATSLPLTVPLSGVGTESKLVIAPSTLNFGSIVVGVPASLTLTLTNAGTAPITNLDLATGGDFAVTLPCPSSTLQPGANCTVQVTFTASALGLRSGSLTVTSSDPSSPLTILLSGTGVQSGSFALAVNGASTAALSVAAGVPAIFQLAATPLQGFSGTLALTCAPLAPGPYASCSLSPASLNLANGTQTAMAAVNTVNSIVPQTRANVLWAVCWLTPLALLSCRRRLRAMKLPVVLCAALAMLAISGCGSRGNPNLRYTPAGTYQYQVTASSTSGIPASQTVTLTVTVLP